MSPCAIRQPPLAVYFMKLLIIILLSCKNICMLRLAGGRDTARATRRAVCIFSPCSVAALVRCGSHDAQSVYWKSGLFIAAARHTSPGTHLLAPGPDQCTAASRVAQPAPLLQTWRWRRCILRRWCERILNQISSLLGLNCEFYPTCTRLLSQWLFPFILVCTLHSITCVSM